MFEPRTAPTLTEQTPGRDGHVVTLRAHRFEDVARVVEQSVDPASRRWTRVPLDYTERQAEQFLGQAMPGGWLTDTEWAFAIDLDGENAGTCSLRDEGPGRAEIAFGAHPAARGTGAVERALRLLLNWGFAEQRLETVVWWANRGNWASRKVAWRLGFSLDGMLPRWLPHRDELTDGWVGTLHRDDPRQPRAPWLEAPVIEGGGVRLRPFRRDDPDEVDRIQAGSSDPVTQHWLAHLPSPYTRADAVAYLETASERLATGAGVAWALVDPSDNPTDPADETTDLLVGTVGLFRLVPGRSVEVGYWAAPEARGRGLTRRGAALAVTHAFEVLGVERVTGYASAPNTASRRILESLGLQQTGIDRLAARTGDGERVDLVGYDLLAEEWWSRAEVTRTPTPTTDRPAPTSAGER